MLTLEPFQTLRFVLMPPESDEGIKGGTKKRRLERSEGYSFVRLKGANENPDSSFLPKKSVISSSVIISI